MVTLCNCKFKNIFSDSTLFICCFSSFLSFCFRHDFLSFDFFRSMTFNTFSVKKRFFHKWCFLHWICPNAFLVSSKPIECVLLSWSTILVRLRWHHFRNDAELLLHVWVRERERETYVGCKNKHSSQKRSWSSRKNERSFDYYKMRICICVWVDVKHPPWKTKKTGRLKKQSRKKRFFLLRYIFTCQLSPILFFW